LGFANYPFLQAPCHQVPYPACREIAVRARALPAKTASCLNTLPNNVPWFDSKAADWTIADWFGIDGENFVGLMKVHPRSLRDLV